MSDDVTSILAEPWCPVEGDHATAMERELRREIGSGHVLVSVRVRAIGRRQDQDDVLFELEGGGWAVVHLTWTSHVEADPRWPNTDLIDSPTALRERLAADALDGGFT